MHQRRIPRKDRAAVEYENKRDKLNLYRIEYFSVLLFCLQVFLVLVTEIWGRGGKGSGGLKGVFVVVVIGDKWVCGG